MLIGEAPLSFQEFMARDPLPLGRVHDAVLEFIGGRADVVLFGAQAVNAYAGEFRATQDVDIASTRGRELAEELRVYLCDRFHIAVRVRDVRDGLGFRVYQVRKEGNRHLVDVRPVASLPPAVWVDDIQVVEPAELIAGKVLAFVGRQGKPKSFTDRRDLAVLLLRFPELKTSTGAVRERLEKQGAPANALAAWEQIAAEDIQPESDDDEF